MSDSNKNSKEEMNKTNGEDLAERIRQHKLLKEMEEEEEEKNLLQEYI